MGVEPTSSVFWPSGLKCHQLGSEGETSETDVKLEHEESDGRGFDPRNERSVFTRSKHTKGSEERCSLVSSTT